MPEVGFQEQQQVSSRSSGLRAHRDASPDSVIFTLESNFSLFSSASASVDRCSFASDAHDHDSFASEISLVIFFCMSKHVIAIDIDENKIDYAHHNAAIYGVDDHIDFINGDFFSLAPKLKTYDIKTMLKPRDGLVLTSCYSDMYLCRYSLFNTAKEIASRLVMFLPRNVDLNQLAELCLSAHPPWALEVDLLILFIWRAFSKYSFGIRLFS
ncbi:trimethylguanosine synthase [Quercus suber]|uniref:Trimethylguanosine synthase n=1 Tax=Quercus suber TaxID=58331 RepID=A0AAW0L2X1_QUESU